MGRNLRLMAAIIVVLCVGSSTRAELIYDAFNNYGTAELTLGWSNLNGGSGWGNFWEGYVLTANRYRPGEQLTLATPGYNNSPNQSGPEDGVVGFGSHDGNHRIFAQPLQGDIWISLLFRLGDNNNFRGVGIGRQWLSTDMFGVDVNGNGWVDAGLGRVFGGSAPFQAVGQLLLNAKVNPTGTDSLRLWVNPSNLTGGVAGLGAPSASVTGVDFMSSLPNLALNMGIGSLVDDIRVSYGEISSSAKLQEIAQGVPVSEHVNVPAGAGISVNTLGGATQVGGATFNFTSTSGGLLTAHYEAMSQQEFFDRLTQGEFVFNDFNFTLPATGLSLWHFGYNGSFAAPIQITLGYDPEAISDPSFIRILHRQGAFWETILPSSYDSIDHTITFQVSDLSPFAVTVVPEPHSLIYLLASLFGITRLRRKPLHR